MVMTSDAVSGPGEVRIPQAVAPPGWRQLGVLVLDGSESMTWEMAEEDASLDGVLPAREKREAVDQAIKTLLNRLQQNPRLVANFAFAMVSYTHELTGTLPTQELSALDPNQSFDPTVNGTGGTRVAAGLAEAGRLIEEFQRTESAKGLPVSAVVLVMSDGEDSDAAAAMSAANELKQLPNVTIASALFATKGGDDGGARLLQAIASSPESFQTVYSAEQLRRFFHASVTRVSPGAIGSGTPTTDGPPPARQG
jgi:uncharacterized protein YegL